mgnify:CR=1 FL=1
MYKFKEQVFSLDEISKAANTSNMDIEDYIKKAGITEEPDEDQDFLNPTAPGAVVGETTAPDMDSPSVSGSLESVDECPDGYTKNSNGDCSKFEFQGQGFGVAKKENAEAAFKAIIKAIELAKDNKIHGIVTAPINKNNIQSNKFNFKGHTDFLESLIGGDSIMFMVSDNLKIALLTEHISINEVTGMITPSLIKKRVKIVQDSLVNDFKVSSPKIAILSINPHVGDGGVIGDHDDKILSPSINEINKNGIKVYGPFASDSFFGSKLYKSYDAIIASYHDQGLIPFKTLAFGNGVNFTAGLDKVRTSPDHGTAYDIAGKNIADPNSFKSAVLQAINILKSRGKI